MKQPYVGSLKGAAASEVDEALREHEGHYLKAITLVVKDEEGEQWEETFLRLRCLICDVDVLELEE